MPQAPDEPVPEIDVAIECPAWNGAVPGAEALCRRASAAALVAAGGGAGEIAILLADDEAVRALNARWRGRDAPTNVLSFPGPDPETIGGAAAPRHLGDIALACETVLREAAEQGKSPADHLTHLVVHGVLHLLGYDHEAEAEAAEMEALEVAVLAGLGVPDPYAAPAEASTASP